MNDTVTTLIIGRIDRDGTNMPQVRWDMLRDRCNEILNEHSVTVVTRAMNADGVTSDQPNAQTEDCAVWVLLPSWDHLSGEGFNLRRNIGALLFAYNLSTACFSTDWSHEPVFSNTYDGYRPDSSGGNVITSLPSETPALAYESGKADSVAPVTSKSYAPTHGGYPNA